ncbi:MAG: bifunctional phosphoribosyl-AMP cyclohydrolase/phosphoribosyl-ATP diphosphatase HisIE [Oceanococcaceae bacterium]
MTTLADTIRWNADGLVCAVVQDAVNGTVLMQAWMNAASLQKTLDTGLATFWSRSRQALWTKGETSNNTLAVRELRLDCDGDCVLVLADPAGPACHTGARDCFFRRAHEGQWVDADPAAATEMMRLGQTIAERRRQMDAGGSYVASLLAKGRSKILQKVGEEAVETVLAGAAGDGEHFVSEAADLLFHLLVAIEEQDVSFADVQQELARRSGLSGLAEKAARKES